MDKFEEIQWGINRMDILPFPKEFIKFLNKPYLSEDLFKEVSLKLNINN